MQEAAIGARILSLLHAQLRYNFISFLLEITIKYLLA